MAKTLDELIKEFDKALEGILPNREPTKRAEVPEPAPTTSVPSASTASVPMAYSSPFSAATRQDPRENLQGLGNVQVIRPNYLTPSATTGDWNLRRAVDPQQVLGNFQPFTVEGRRAMELLEAQAGHDFRETKAGCTAMVKQRRAEAGTNIAIMGAMDEIGGIDLEEAQATSKAVIGSLKRAPAFTRARAEVQFQLGEQAHRQDTGLLELAGRLLAD